MAEFLESVIQGLGPKLRQQITTPEQRQQLETGLVAVLSTAETVLVDALGADGRDLLVRLKSDPGGASAIGQALRGKGDDLIEWLEVEAQEQGLEAPSLDKAFSMAAGLIHSENFVNGIQINVESRSGQSERAEESSKQRYLEDLIFHCRSLPLRTLGDKRGLIDEITLDRVFIELETTTLIGTEKSEAGSEPPEALGEDPRREQRRLTAAEAAERFDRLVLTGDPGGGKSSFVKELLARQALSLLAPESCPPSEGFEDLVPILIELRLLAGRLEKPSLIKSETRRRKELAATVLDHPVEALAGTACADFGPELRRRLEKGECLLVLDGLDEVATTLRPVVREAVAAALGRSSFRRVVVSCRTRSYADENLQLRGFEAHELAKLDDPRIQNFARRWYEVQALKIGQQKAQEWGQDLAASAIAPDLREMAGNPMLLTAMALVHQDRHRLPQKRAKLYYQAVEVLALRWQEQKNDGTELPPELAEKWEEDDNRRWRILEFLGFKAHQIRSTSQQEDRGELTEGFLIGELSRPDLFGCPALAQTFLRFIDQRAGLLLSSGSALGEAPSFRFAHQTLQEYLAGRYLMATTDRLGRCREYSEKPDFWNLPILLGAEDLLHQKQEEAQFLALAQGLNPEDEPSTATAAFLRCILWAGAMAEQLGTERLEAENARSFLARLRHRLGSVTTSDLGAMDRIEAGRLLGGLGEPDDSLTSVAKLELCWVPKGKFFFSGAGKKEEGDWDDLDYGYWIGRFPVTNGQFQKFVESGGYGTERYWLEAKAAEVWSEKGFEGRWDNEPRKRPLRLGEPFSLPNHPVVGVSWYEMLAFCRWLTERARKKGWIPETSTFCLPSELEWEMAARGGVEIPREAIVVSLRSKPKEPAGRPVENPEAERQYPWVGEEAENRGNFGGFGSSSRPGIFPLGQSPVGCEDMAGNVWEWTRSLGDKGRRGEQVNAATIREELRAGEDQRRYLRGGSYYEGSNSVGCSARDRVGPSNRDNFIGFRVVLLPFTLDSGNSEL